MTDDPEPRTNAFAEWRKAQHRRLYTFIRADMWLTAGSGVYVFIVYWFVTRQSYLLATTVVVELSAGIMYTALRAAQRGAVADAVGRLAAANWLVVVVAAFLAAPVWPVIVLAALIPVTVAASYVEQESFRWYLIGSVTVAGIATACGLFVTVTPMERDVPAWAIDSVLIIFIPSMTALIGLLALQNFTRTRTTLANLMETHLRLQTQSDALAASRSRMVAATDSERRRIERDLHDGTQQHFVSMGLRLGAIRRALHADPARAEALIDELKSEMKAAQAELREYTLGIYPPTLTQHGLAAALHRAVDRVALPTVTSINDVGRLDPGIEASAYFICLEALTNADKHAGRDATVTLSLSLDDGCLRFEVADDGVGYELDAGDVRRSGTQNMEDRIAAVRGMLSVSSDPGVGTVVIGEIPVGMAGLRSS